MFVFVKEKLNSTCVIFINGTTTMATRKEGKKTKGSRINLS